MSDVKWIKITTDIFDDEKILLIESLPECDSIIVIWFKLLCFAGKTNNSGVFLMGDSIPYTDGMLATIFRRKEATVKMALDIFERFGMIERLDGNALNSMSISLPHWLEKLTGFSSVGFNVGYWSAPMVPYLAQGAVIPPNKEFMAVLGDQKNGNNIEAPESLIRRIVREESGNNGTRRIEVPVYLNRREIARAVLEEGRCLRTVTGRNPFELI